MNNKIISRIISVGILAIIATCILHILHAEKFQMGREAYLAEQAAFYDRYYAHSASIAAGALATLSLAGIFYGVYELIAFVVLKILERINAEEPNS